MVNEFCPMCENEVELLNDFKIQICPSCGEKILPCAMCNIDAVDCVNCPLEK